VRWLALPVWARACGTVLGGGSLAGVRVPGWGLSLGSRTIDVRCRPHAREKGGEVAPIAKSAHSAGAYCRPDHFYGFCRHAARSMRKVLGSLSVTPHREQSAGGPPAKLGSSPALEELRQSSRPLQQSTCKWEQQRGRRSPPVRFCRGRPSLINKPEQPACCAAQPPAVATLGSAPASRTSAEGCHSSNRAPDHGLPARSERQCPSRPRRYADNKQPNKHSGRNTRFIIVFRVRPVPWPYQAAAKQRILSFIRPSTPKSSPSEILELSGTAPDRQSRLSGRLSASLRQFS